MSDHTKTNASALSKAKDEAQRLLALLSEIEPNADEIKSHWYEAGLAIRAAIAELRAMETAPLGTSRQANQNRREQR